MKGNYTYKLSLDIIASPEGTLPDGQISTSFKLTNHDNIFSIISKLKEKKIFITQNETEEFAIGLKLFSEIMLRNRDNELFSELGPEFKKFMKKLKSQ